MNLFNRRLHYKTKDEILEQQLSNITINISKIEVLNSKLSILTATAIYPSLFNMLFVVVLNITPIKKYTYIFAPIVLLSLSITALLCYIRIRKIRTIRSNIRKLIDEIDINIKMDKLSTAEYIRILNKIKY